MSYQYDINNIERDVGYQIIIITIITALVAQLDACPTDDREIAGSIPTWSGSILL